MRKFDVAQTFVVSSPADILELLLERLIEPPVEDRVGEGRGHPDQVTHGEAYSVELVNLKGSEQLMTQRRRTSYSETTW